MSSGEQDSTTTAANTEEEGNSTATSEQQEDSSAKPEQTSEERDGEEDAKEGEATTSEPEKASPLEEKIIRQVEFYFGDRNFPRDKFLQQAAAANSDGWVPLVTLLTFNRLKALSSDAEFICSALRKTTAGLIQVSEDGKNVRRHPDRTVPDIYANDFRKDVRERSIYAKGFPEDTTLDQIQDFMDQYGKIHFIQMRRTYVEKTFKGSIFAEFDRVEDAENFVKKGGIQFNGEDLLIEWKKDYFKRKQEEKKQKKDEAVEAKGEDGEGKEEGEGGESESVVKVSGCVLHFSGVGEDKTREDIKEELLQFGTVAYIDFERGKTEGYVRFREEGAASKAREGLLERAVGNTSVPQLCGADTELRVLEGSEEEQYWHKVLESGLGKGKRGGRGGRRGGRGGGRGGNRGRGGGRGDRKRKVRLSEGTVEDGDASPPESKTIKTED